MARTTYKDMSLGELEAKAAEREAASQRIPAALKQALDAARAAAAEAAAPAQEPEAADDAAAKEAAFTEAIVGVMSGAVSVDEAYTNLTGEEPEDSGRDHISIVEGALADPAPGAGPNEDNTVCGTCGKLRAECGGHEITDEAVVELAAQERRVEFTRQMAVLLDGGHDEAVALEALTADGYGDLAEEYKAMHAMDASTVRDPSEIDMATGEVKPKEAAKPYAIVDATPYPVTFYRPVLKVIVPDPDDPTKETVEELTCEHVAKYGHGSEDAALKCARSMAYQRGLKLA